jgi:hypothetical protein
MKRILSIMLVAVSVVILHFKTVIAQDTKAPAKSKTEKHIKMLKVDDDGKKTEIDTVITSDAPFVWNGDTIDGGKEVKWITRSDFTMDSVHQFDYKIDGDGNHKVMIMHSGDGEPMIWAPAAPGAPPVPHAPRMIRFSSSHGKNVIDLSDPGIISYDKKLRKDGTEKITIVRKQVPENEEMEEDVFIHAPGAPAEFGFQSGHPENVKTVHVVKSDDGSVNVYEDEKVVRVKGEKIKVKEIKEGDETKVEVEVEVDDEKENK